MNINFEILKESLMDWFKYNPESDFELLEPNVEDNNITPSEYYSPHTDGGFVISSFIPLDYLKSTGNNFKGERGEKIQKWIDSIDTDVVESFNKKFNTNIECYNDAESIGKENEFEEIESLWYDDCMVQIKLKLYYYLEGNYHNDLQTDSVYVQLCINDESPYHRERHDDGPGASFEITDNLETDIIQWLDSIYPEF